MYGESLPGNARCKRNQWSRKKTHGKEVKFSKKYQKHKFQRKFRNGKNNYDDVPRKGNHYRKFAPIGAVWEMVS